MKFNKRIKIAIKDFLMCRKYNSRTSDYDENIDDCDIPECPICFKDTTNSMVTFLKCDHWACSDCIHRITNLTENCRRCHICRLAFKQYPLSGEVY